MREKLLALFAVFVALNRRLGTELLETLRHIHEFDIGPKVEALVTPKMDRRGQIGLQTVLAALVLVIATSLAVIIVDKFDSNLGTPSSSSLSQAQSDVLGGFSTMTSLIGPLLLVAISVVIIGLIRRVS